MRLGPPHRRRRRAPRRHRPPQRGPAVGPVGQAGSRRPARRPAGSSSSTLRRPPADADHPGPGPDRESAPTGCRRRRPRPPPAPGHPGVRRPPRSAWWRYARRRAVPPPRPPPTRPHRDRRRRVHRRAFGVAAGAAGGADHPSPVAPGRHVRPIGGIAPPTPLPGISGGVRLERPGATGALLRLDEGDVRVRDVDQHLPGTGHRVGRRCRAPAPRARRTHATRSPA